MRAATVLKLALALVAVLAIALVAAVKSIDVNDYRRLIAEAITAETGRRFDIAGDFELQLSLRPRLVASDLSLANGPGGSRDSMLRIARVEAEIGLLPLLRREIRIHRLVLSEPDLLLEHNADGRPNWLLYPPGATVAAAQDAPRTTVVIDKVRLEKARVTLHDARDNSTRNLLLDRVTIDPEGPAGPVSLTAVGTLDRGKLDISGTFGSLAELRAQTKPFPVKLTASVGGVVAVADGTVGKIAAGDGLDLKLSLEATETAEAAGLAGVTAPALGPLRATARLKGSVEAPQLPELDLSVGKKDGLRLSAKGAVKAPLTLSGLDVAVTAEAADAAPLLRLAGVQEPPAQPFKLTGQLAGGGDAFTLSGAKASLGQSDLAGTASLRLGGERPSITAALASKQLDLADFGVKPQAKPENTARGASLFPEEPLELSGLRRVDADATWQAERLVAHGIAVEQVDARLTLKDGVLTVDPASAKLNEGRLQARMVVDAKAATPQLRATLSAERVDMGRLLAATGLSQALSNGRGDFRAEFAGKGRSVQAIMAGLDGETALIIDGATIDNSYTDLLAFDVMRQLAPWSPREERTELNCLVGRFVVAKGVATSRTLLFDTSHVTMGGNATIDLGRQSVQATLVPRAKQASLINLATPMDVSGPLTDPSVTPNAAALAKDVATGVLGAAINPLGVLLPFVTAGSGDDNACLTALRQIKQPADKPRAGKRKQPALAVPGLGGLLDDIFGSKKQ